MTNEHITVSTPPRHGAGAEVEWLAISNPVAGGGRAGPRVPALLASLMERGLRLEHRQTEGPGDATRLADQGYLEGYRHFLAIGGDGTALEVLNGCLPPALTAGQQVGLGLLPLGTGNSFVEHFREQSEPADADRSTLAEVGCKLLLQAHKTGTPRYCDVLRATHDQGETLVLGAVHIGFTAQVAGFVNRNLKRLGVLGYTLGAMVKLLRLSSLELDLDWGNGPAKKKLLVTALQNIVHVGGNMRIAPGADPTDGLMDLVLIDEISRLSAFRAFPSLFPGRHLAHPAVNLVRTERVDFQDPPPGDVMLDGEVLQLRIQSVEVLPGVLEVWI